MIDFSARPDLRRVVLLALTVATAGACYDSRWGETKRAQQRALQASTPAEVRAAGSGARDAKVTTFRARVVATTRFTAQTVDAKKQVSDLVDAANRILEPSVGARLEIERFGAWDSTTADEDLTVALAALRKDEPGDGVDWVLGLVGGLPRFTPSFHDVGRAEVLGKHVVLRAAARQEETDRIEAAFDELSQDERTRLRRDRKEHRALTVLLHEIGHTLGAPHEVDVQSLMHFSYDPKMAGFSLEATEMMRMAVGHRARASAEHPVDPRALAGDLAAYLRGSTSRTWSAQDHDEALAQLEGLAGKGPPSAPAAPATSAPAPAAFAASAAPSAPAADPLAGMRDADRAVFARATQWFQAGQAPQAHQIARPLFDAYPDLYAVQDLRCQLAVLRRVDAQVRAKECAALQRLSPK
jgi:Matrixin